MLFSWNWANCWRATFILLLVAGLFGFVDQIVVAHILGLIGGIFFIAMCVIRFDDVKKFVTYMIDEFGT